jgi:hypothetical protein
MYVNHNAGSPRVLGYSWACPSVSWHLVDENTHKDEKGYMKLALGMEVPQLLYVPRVGLHYAVGFFGSFRWRSRVTHILWCCGCVGLPSGSPNHVKRTSVADEWAWSSLPMSGVPGGSIGEQHKMFGMPLTILGVGLEQLLPHTTSVSPTV